MSLKEEGEWMENTESHKAESKSWVTYHPESHCELWGKILPVFLFIIFIEVNWHTMSCTF